MSNHAVLRNARTPIRHCSHERMDLDASIFCPDCGHTAVSIIDYQRQQLEQFRVFARALAEARRVGSGPMLRQACRVDDLLEAVG